MKMYELLNESTSFKYEFEYSISILPHKDKHEVGTLLLEFLNNLVGLQPTIITPSFSNIYECTYEVNSSQKTVKQMINYSKDIEQFFKDNKELAEFISIVTTITCYDKPTELLDATVVTLKVNRPYNLIDIETLIGLNCESLIIQYPGNITGGILKLFKLPKNLSITFFTIQPGSELKHMIEIINKYIDDRHILKCQKELIANGFKDYC